MKRKLILLAVTIVFLAGFGALLHSPPSMIDKAVEKIAVIESEKQPSSGRKNGCAEAGNVAPSKVTEKYKSNKYHEVNYCYGEGESL